MLSCTFCLQSRWWENVRDWDVDVWGDWGERDVRVWRDVVLREEDNWLREEDDWRELNNVGLLYWPA